MEVPEATNSDTSFTSKIRSLQKENAKLTSELSQIKRVAQEACSARLQLEEEQKLSEIRICDSQNEIERLKEDNVRSSLQVKRLGWRRDKLKYLMRVACSALQKCGVVADNAM